MTKNKIQTAKIIGKISEILEEQNIFIKNIKVIEKENSVVFNIEGENRNYIVEVPEIPESVLQLPNSETEILNALKFNVVKNNTRNKRKKK